MKQDQDLWSQEYTTEGIPSSFRSEPSGALRGFLDFLATRDLRYGTAIDLGCGRGRNTLHLALKGFSVSAFDLVADNIWQLCRMSERLHVDALVDAEVVDLQRPWPIADRSVNVAIDTFCYKHQTAVGAPEFYRSELARVLKPGGYLLLTLAGLDDGYYGPLLARSPDSGRNVIVDPNNGISSILYAQHRVVADFSKFMDLEQVEHKVKDGVMHGSVYRRSTLVFYFRRAS